VNDANKRKVTQVYGGARAFLGNTWAFDPKTQSRDAPMTLRLQGNRGSPTHVVAQPLHADTHPRAAVASSIEPSRNRRTEKGTAVPTPSTPQTRGVSFKNPIAKPAVRAALSPRAADRAALREYRSGLAEIPREIAAIQVSLLDAIAHSREAKTYNGTPYPKTTADEILKKVDATEMVPVVRRLRLQLQRELTRIEKEKSPGWSAQRLTIMRAIARAQRPLETLHMSYFDFRAFASAYLETLTTQAPRVGLLLQRTGQIGTAELTDAMKVDGHIDLKQHPADYADRLLFHPIFFTDRSLTAKAFNRISPLKGGFAGILRHGESADVDGGHEDDESFPNHDLRHHFETLMMGNAPLGDYTGRYTPMRYAQMRGRNAVRAYLAETLPKMRFYQAFAHFLRGYPPGGIDERIADVAWFQLWHDGIRTLPQPLSPAKFAETPPAVLAGLIHPRLLNLKDFGTDFSASERAEITPERVAKVMQDFHRFLARYGEAQKKSMRERAYQYALARVPKAAAVLAQRR
jgi:hypothetical protein